MPWRTASTTQTKTGHSKTTMRTTEDPDLSDSVGAYQICNRLVMDTSDPSITFDADGICSHYIDFQKHVAAIWEGSLNGDRQPALAQMIKQIKAEGRTREFDCIIGLSGGVDSSYLLHTIVNQCGLRPLVFHVDGGWNSEVAVHNISSLIDGLGLDLYTEVIDWSEMRDFQLAMFKSGVPHVDLPQDHAFVGVLYRFAREHGIKYILNGGNISTECVRNPLKYFYWGTDMRQIRDILSKFGTVPMRTYPFSSIFYHRVYLPYIHGIRVAKPLNFVPYLRADAMRLLTEKYGWRPYENKHYESRFTRFFEGWWLPTRFGFDVRRVQYSSLILTGQMTRDEALEKLKQPPYDPAVARQDFEYVAAKLGISTDELEEYHKMPLKYYYNYRNLRTVFDLGEQVLWRFTGKRRGGGY